MNALLLLLLLWYAGYYYYYYYHFIVVAVLLVVAVFFYLLSIFVVFAFHSIISTVSVIHVEVTAPIDAPAVVASNGVLIY